jgi:hypothetical protein
MAGDLIPPPSPAGRPPPDPPAEAEATEQLQEATGLATEAAVGVEPQRRAPAPYRGRFGFVFGALAGMAVCAVALAVVLVAAPGEEGVQLAPHWSAWKPGTSDMLSGASDIASHVGLEYELGNGDQLAQVSSSAIELSGEPLGVAVRPQDGELRFLEGDGLLYVLRGLGPSGSLPGTATKARGRLLSREALELSLYSFRYLDDITMVAVLLPPTARQVAAASPGSQESRQNRAIFYRPGDLLSQLQVPLADTLAAKTPRPTTMAKAEAARVDSLTLRNLFLASIQPLKENQSYLVLAEPDKVE